MYLHLHRNIPTPHRWHGPPQSQDRAQHHPRRACDPCPVAPSSALKLVITRKPARRVPRACYVLYPMRTPTAKHPLTSLACQRQDSRNAKNCNTSLSQDIARSQEAARSQDTRKGISLLYTTMTSCGYPGPRMPPACPAQNLCRQHGFSLLIPCRQHVLWKYDNLLHT